MDISAIEYIQDIRIVAMFLIVQFLGLLLAAQIYSVSTFTQVSPAQAFSSASGVLIYVIYIAFIGVIVAIILKYYKGRRLFILLEAYVIFVSSFVVFLVVIGTITGTLASDLYGNGLPQYTVLVLILSAAMVLAKNKWPKLRNSAAIIASVGVGLVLGVSFTFVEMIILMTLLAIYDYIAVFITKHMVTMGNAMVNMNLAFLVGSGGVEAVPRSSLSKAELEAYKKQGRIFKSGSPTMSEIKNRNLVPIFTRRELGTGDLAIPLAVAVSAQNLYLSFFVILGSTLGLVITMMILRKYKRALPAIPPLLFGVLLGVGVYLLL